MKNPDANTIENEFYKITYDPAKGRVSSLIDKRTGREWADVTSQTGLGQYLNERFTYEQTLEYTTQYQQGRAVNSFGTDGDWPHPGMYKPGMISAKEVPYRSAMPRNGSLKITDKTFCQIMTINYPPDTANFLPATMLTITLQNNMPFVDMEITIKSKEKDNWPQADWFCFPFKIAQPTFTVGRTLGVMNPVSDIMDGANRDLYAVGAGVSITDADGEGVVVCPVDHPLVSLDRPGIWKFSHDFVPQRPIVYINLFNNQWNTNFRYWYAGTWSSRVRIWTFGKNLSAANAFQVPSFEARTPLLVAIAQGKGGTLPESQSGIAVSRHGVEVTAFKTDYLNNDKKNKGQTLLRVWEQAGDRGNLSIILPKGKTFLKATPVNLRNEVTGNPIQLTKNKFDFNLSSYAPASFILE